MHLSTSTSFAIAKPALESRYLTILLHANSLCHLFSGTELGFKKILTTDHSELESGLTRRWYPSSSILPDKPPQTL